MPKLSELGPEICFIASFTFVCYVVKRFLRHNCEQTQEGRHRIALRCHFFAKAISSTLQDCRKNIISDCLSFADVVKCYQSMNTSRNSLGLQKSDILIIFYFSL